MENEIKVNDYVRLKDGTIAKVIEIKNQDTDILNWYCLNNNMGTMDRSIVKHSPNIIDLIQCGDYVNGIKIISIIQQADTKKTISLCGFDNDYLDIKLYNRDIITVVTKEMMKSIEYRVNRDMETN